MPQSLEGKAALVTGGSRGIGAAIAKRLAANGARVAITYARDADAATAVVKAIEASGGKALAIKADAADVEAIQAAIEETVEVPKRGRTQRNSCSSALALLRKPDWPAGKRFCSNRADKTSIVPCRA